MDSILERAVRNSELKIEKSKRAFLTYESEGLVSSRLEETEDGIIFHFATEGLESAKKIEKRTKEERFRFLFNCGSLSPLFDKYEFSLSPDNLMMDLNLVPKVLLRDTRNNESKDFLSGYKALIGSVLVSRYSYEDFLEGGKDLFQKSRLLRELVALESVPEIEAVLRKEYEKEVNEIKENQQLIPKKRILVTRIVVPLLILALVVSAFFLYQSLFIHIPYGTAMTQARDAYIANEPLRVQEILKSYGIDELSHETKYILSRSYVVTEVLPDDEKEYILTRLTIRTDGYLLAYWIHLGRLEFEEAIDIAGRFNDSELLLFAYMKFEAVVLHDHNIRGEERTVLINHIQSRIEGLLRNREETAAEMAEEQNATPEIPTLHEIDSEEKEIPKGYDNDEEPVNQEEPDETPEVIDEVQEESGDKEEIPEDSAQEYDEEG